MTDFDVALRVRLAYEPAAAKTAVADLDALRRSAACLGAETSTIATARPLAGLGQQAQVARASVDDLARAGARLGGLAQAGRSLSGDMRGVAAATASASDAVRAFGTRGAASSAAPLRLENELATLLGPGAPQPFRPVSPSPEPDAVMPRATPNHAAFDRPLSAPPQPAPAGPAQPGRGMALAAEGARQGAHAVDQLRHAADDVGKATGAGKLAEGLAAITPAAVEARRHVDDVADAARHAQRDLENMGRAAAAAGGAGGTGGAGGGDAGGHGAAAAAGGARHAGPGGPRGALIAGARPLRMERLLQSAFTPVGLAGLAGGLGLAEIGRGLKAVEDQAIGFEATMVQVRRAAGDMPDDGVKRLEATILDTSRATGAAKEEVAGLAAAALRAGQPMADMPRLLDFGAKAANVMGVKVEEAGARLIEMRRAWGKDQGGVEDTVNAAALAGQKTGANPASLVDLANRHADMRMYHMSARQVVGMGAGFQAAGLDPSQAEGAFTGLSDKLLHPENNKQFGTELFRLGIGPTEARLNMRGDATHTMMQVLEKLKAKPEGERANIMERAFGPDAARDMGQIVNQLDEVKRALGLVEDEAQRTGAVDRFQKVFDDTATAKIEKAGRAFEGFAAKIGKAFLPAVKAAADGTARLFDELGQDSKGAMGVGDSASDIWSKVTGSDKRSDAYKEMLKQRARTRGAKTPEEEEAWIKANRPGDYDAIYRPERRVKDDREAAPRADATRADVQPAPGHANNLDALKRAEAFDERLLSQARPEQAAGIRRQLDDIRRQISAASASPQPVQRYASGGRVTGPGGPREDRIHAMLSDGEFVIRASEAAKHHGTLTAINEGRVPRFATGGRVDLLGGALAHDATGESMPARALARGVERAGDPDRLASAIARLSPAGRDGKALTADQVKEAIATGSKEGIKAGLREAMDLRGGRAAAGGLIQAGDGTGGSGEGGGGQPLANPSLRYGGGYGPGGRLDPDGSVHHRSMRFHGGYGPRPDVGHGQHPSARPHPHDRHLDPERMREQAKRHGRGRSDDAPADGGGPRPSMPDGEGRADPASLKGVLFKGESGGDPGIYNHRVGRGYRTGHLDPNKTTVAELQRRQAAGEVFAAGKYQIIPKTMKGAVKALGLKGDETFDSALQDRIYTDYLAGSKRPQISDYVTGKSDDLRGANIATAEEWASVGDPSRGGRGHYDGDGANHASISVDRALSALTKARADYQHLIEKGVDPETARRSALLGIRDPKSGAPAAPPPVAARPAAPGQPPAQPPVAAAQPPHPRRSAAAAPASPAPVRMATGGRVVGPGGPREDRVPALLSHGEFVITAAAAAKHPGLLDDINGDRIAARSVRPAPLSPRFADPGGVPTASRAPEGVPSSSGAPAAGVAPAAGPPAVQNFYGMHDPAVTARRAMLENNREVRRAQARALHSVGRVA